MINIMIYCPALATYVQYKVFSQLLLALSHGHCIIRITIYDKYHDISQLYIHTVQSILQLLLALPHGHCIIRITIYDKYHDIA